jgi:hypothetical protein
VKIDEHADRLTTVDLGSCTKEPAQGIHSSEKRFSGTQNSKRIHRAKVVCHCVASTVFTNCCAVLNTKRVESWRIFSRGSWLKLSLALCAEVFERA